MRESQARVVAVSRDGAHRFSKRVHGEIILLPGLGVQGDSHAGDTVQHRSRVAADPTQPNLRQVHLVPAELHVELREQGFDVGPGQLGENVLTAGLDLLALPRDTVLLLGEHAAVQVTGLRNPCAQIDRFRPGMLRAVVGRDAQGGIVRKAGIMGIVTQGGRVRSGERIEVRMPAAPHQVLQRV